MNNNYESKLIIIECSVSRNRMWQIKMHGVVLHGYRWIFGQNMSSLYFHARGIMKTNVNWSAKIDSSASFRYICSANVLSKLSLACLPLTLLIYRKSIHWTYAEAFEGSVKVFVWALSYYSHKLSPPFLYFDNPNLEIATTSKMALPGIGNFLQIRQDFPRCTEMVRFVRFAIEKWPWSGPLLFRTRPVYSISYY